MALDVSFYFVIVEAEKVNFNSYFYFLLDLF